MVHWVYVLECEDDFIYVGETTRLFSRLDEHWKGKGSDNTHRHKPQTLIGLYKVGDNQSFRDYRNGVLNGFYEKYILERWGEGGDHLEIENAITERFLYDRKDNDCYGGGMEWYKVRGGKYTRITMEHSVMMYKWATEKEGRGYYSRNPIDSIPVNKIVDRPLCKHGYPSEVKISKDGTKIYFVCAVKNVWDNFYNRIAVEKDCGFWQIYNEDKEVKRIFELNEKYRKEPWLDKLPRTASRMEPDPCISCNTENYRPIWSLGSLRQLCEKCLAFKHDSLMKEYSKPKCMIIDD